MNIDKLREEVGARMSSKRFSHTLGVERCAARLALKLLPNREEDLRAAALLHDISKEITASEQIALLEGAGFDLTDEDRKTEGILHSFCAHIIIKRDFPQFAKEEILSAVEKHTVGDEDMSVFEKIIFISDYAEDTRKYTSCINVRAALFDGFEKLSAEDALSRLDMACLASIEGALIALSMEGRAINSRMYKTRKSLLKNNL